MRTESLFEPLSASALSSFFNPKGCSFGNLGNKLKKMQCVGVLFWNNNFHNLLHFKERMREFREYFKPDLKNIKFQEIS